MKRRSSQARPKTDGVTVDDCRVRLQTGQPVTFVDARRHEDWAAADQMVRGAVRLGPGDGRSYLPDPKRGYIVVYCG